MHGGWHHAETVLEKQWSLLYESLRNLLGTTGVGVDQVGKNEQKKEDMRMIITRSLYFGTLDARENVQSPAAPYASKLGSAINTMLTPLLTPLDLVRSFHESEQYDAKNGYFTLLDGGYDWPRYQTDLANFKKKRAAKSFTAEMVQSALLELGDLLIFEDALHFRLAERITLVLKANAPRWTDIPKGKWR
jgi:hypothetical protein